MRRRRVDEMHVGAGKAGRMRTGKAVDGHARDVGRPADVETAFDAGVKRQAVREHHQRFKACAEFFNASRNRDRRIRSQRVCVNRGDENRAGRRIDARNGAERPLAKGCPETGLDHEGADPGGLVPPGPAIAPRLEIRRFIGAVQIDDDGRHGTLFAPVDGRNRARPGRYEPDARVAPVLEKKVAGADADAGLDDRARRDVDPVAGDHRRLRDRGPVD